MEDFGRREGQVLVAHRAVRRAEINRSLQDLPLSATGADGLIVETDGWIDFAVFVKPLGVNGIRKGGARAVDEQLRGNVRRERHRHRRQDHNLGPMPHASHNQGFQ